MTDTDGIMTAMLILVVISFVLGLILGIYGYILYSQSPNVSRLSDDSITNIEDRPIRDYSPPRNRRRLSY